MIWATFDLESASGFNVKDGGSQIRSSSHKRQGSLVVLVKHESSVGIALFQLQKLQPAQRPTSIYKSAVNYSSKTLRHFQLLTFDF